MVCAADRWAVLAATAAAVLAASCGHSASPEQATRVHSETQLLSQRPNAMPMQGTTTQTIPTTTAAGPQPSSQAATFLRALRHACLATRAQPTAATSRDDRAAPFRREAKRLAGLARRLERMNTPARAEDLLGDYRDALRAQISIDRRLARAIAVGDHSSEVVGTRQNDYNRRTRSRLAVRIGLSCLRDVEPR
jgi:hypothetical protein